MTSKIHFTLPAEYVHHASDGILLGEFNNWNPDEGIPLQKKEDGSLHAEIVLTAGRSYQYRYLLSDGRWANDQRNTTLTQAYGAEVENCVVEVPMPATKKESIKKATAKKIAKPADKKAAVADDLGKMEGIGKKIASLLNKAGIVTYKDLAKTTIKNLNSILEEAGNEYKMHNPASWPKQAKLAASRKWEELEVLQSQLKAGK
jgi:predicted flap endonuclease-1-like 5' DNA nuclease